jgi:hypothetical protein
MSETPGDYEQRMKVTRKRTEISIETHERRSIHLVSGPSRVCPACGTRIPATHANGRSDEQPIAGALPAPADEADPLARSEPEHEWVNDREAN